MRRIRRLSKSFLLIITLAFSFVFTDIISAEAAIKVPTVKDTYEAKDPDNLLGIAADFGLFIKENLNVNADIETPFVTNKLFMNRGFDMYGGNVSYFNEIFREYADPNGLQITNKDGQEKKLYIGTDSALSKVNNNDNWLINGWYKEWNKEFVRSNISIGNYIKQVYYAPNFININQEFNKLVQLTEQLYNEQNSDAKFGYYVNNQGHTETNKLQIVCGDSNYCVINVKASEFSTDNKLDVFIKNLVNKDKSGKLLIINVTDMPNDKNYNFNVRINLDGTGENEAFNKYSSNVIWNFGQFNREIKTNDHTAGVFLSPNASINLAAGNHDGIIIASNFTNNSEAHYVPFTSNKKFSSVDVFIETVDGTTCPSTPIDYDGEYALYKMTGKKSKKVTGSTKGATAVKTDDGIDTYIAEWTISEAGEYYIQQTKKESDGYLATPIKCMFIVKLNDEGRLELIRKEDAKENNGESDKQIEIVVDGVEKKGFKLRNYQNVISVAGLNSKGNKVLKEGQYSLYKCESTDINGTIPSGIALDTKDVNEDGYVNFNVTGLGYYCIVKDKKTPKYIVVYRSPIGHLVPVELDNKEFGNKMISVFYNSDNFMIPKLTKRIVNGLANLEAEYGIDTFSSYTDNWIIF